jgi:hypothetical protein
VAGNRVQRSGTAYTAKDAARRHKRPCRSAPSTPGSVAVVFRRIQRKGKRVAWNAIVTFNATTTDVASRPITVELYQAQLRYTDASGVPITIDGSADDVEVETLPGDDTPRRIVFKDLSRPRQWYVQVRLRTLNRIHGGRCWSAWSAWTTPAVQPSSGALSGPGAPAGVALTIDRVEGTARYPWRGRAVWNELTTWSPTDDDGIVEVTDYHAQLACSHDAGTSTANTRNMHVPADQSLTTNKADFFNLRGKYHYRMRVRAKDADGVWGSYSGWTAWVSPGGVPNPVTGLTWSNPTPATLVAKWTQPANMQNVDRYHVRVFRQPGSVLVDDGYTGATRWRYEIPKADRDNAHKVRVNAEEPIPFTDADAGATGQAAPDASSDTDSGDTTNDAWSIETRTTGTRMELTPEGLRTIESGAVDDVVTAELLPDGSSFGVVGIGEVVSDNVVSVNRETRQRFIDPVYGSDDTGNGLAPKAIVDTFNRVSSNGWGESMSGGWAEKTLQTSAAADDIIDCTAHGLVVDQAVVFTNLTGGAGLTPGVVYFVTATSFGANTFRVSATSGGADINFTTDITAGNVIPADFHAWDIYEGTASKFTTDRTGGGRARMALGASDSLGIWARSGGMFDEVVTKVQADKIPATANLRMGVVFRAHDQGGGLLNGYWARILVAAGGGVPTMDVLRLEGATSTVIATAVALPDGQNFAANADWSIRAQCFYDYEAGATTVRMKAWKSSGAEPSTWSYSVTEDGSAAVHILNYQRGGSIGFRTLTGAITNTILTVSYSAFTYKMLDPDLLAADSSSAAAGDYDMVFPVGAEPYQTLERALRDVPSYNQARVFINYHNGWDVRGKGLQESDEPRTYLDGFVGGGEMFLTGAGGRIIGGLIINGCAHWIQSNGLIFSDSGGGNLVESDATIRVNASRHIEVINNRIQSNGVATRCINFTQSSGGIVRLTQLNGAARAVTAGEASVIQCYDNRGAGSTSGYQANSGIIMSQGSAPTGGSSASNSGKIFASVTNDAPTSTDGGTAPPTSTKRTKSWKAIGGSTYGLTFNTWSPGDATQGAYGGGQNHKGMWRFPDGVQSTLTGKTIDSGTITVRRLTTGGTSGPQPIYLFTANTNALSGGEPGITSGPVLLGSLAWGDSKTFRIPKSLLDDLKTAVGGKTRLLGLYQSDGSPYVICGPQPVLKVTYH